MGSDCPICGQPISDQTELIVSLESNTIFYRGQTMQLDPLCAEIMFALNNAPAQYMTYDALYRAVYGNRVGGGPVPKVLPVKVSLLRKVLEGSGLGIQTVWGRGHKLTCDPDAPATLSASPSARRAVR